MIDKHGNITATGQRTKSLVDNCSDMNVLEPTKAEKKESVGYYTDDEGKDQPLPGITTKGRRIPQTAEEFAYLADLYEQAMLNQFKQNGELRHKINTLEQRIQVQSNNLARLILERENNDET